MYFLIQTKSWSSAWNRLSTVSELNQVISQRVLTHEVGAWEKKRNELEKRIEWKFSRKNADEKMSKYYAQ